MTGVSRTALVLGGGGSTGNAWLIGVVAGLFDSGVDIVATADVTSGTSAGSTAAAQLAGADASDLYADVLATAVQPPPSAAEGRGAHRPVGDHLDRVARIIASATDAADYRRKMGAAALELDAADDSDWQARWRTTVAARLTGPHGSGERWPERRLLITAVDAGSGEPVVFDRTSGVDLVDAVAASCSSGRPYRIAGTPYIDGGFRANAENADLADGYDRVLVLSPFGGNALTPVEWGTRLSTQVDELRATGSTVETIIPTAESEHMFGANAMEGSLRPAAARAGFAQGRGRAEEVAGLWSAPV